MLCGDCKNGVCKDAPNPQEPLEVNVDGRWATIDKCPYHYIDAGVIDACRCCDLMDSGCLPASGGYIDQTEVGLAAVGCLKQDEAALRDNDTA